MSTNKENPQTEEDNADSWQHISEALQKLMDGFSEMFEEGEDE